MTQHVFHTFMPYAAGLDSLAASASKLVDVLHDVGFTIAYSLMFAVVGFLLTSVYDRCSWNRPSGNVLSLHLSQ